MYVIRNVLGIKLQFDRKGIDNNNSITYCSVCQQKKLPP